MQLAQVLLRLQEKKPSSNDDKKEPGNSSNIKDRENDKNDDENQPYKGTVDCILRLYQRNGISAMYKGMNAKLLQTVLTAAFTFLTYEQILSAVQKSANVALFQSMSSLKRRTGSSQRKF
mmetsp:Transcript_52496/g.78224  ORF Transcript_52496/g.78224 Transcript_52496/m.78224 type:complete len:120 (+) Transcript_52496:453-812(+)